MSYFFCRLNAPRPTFAQDITPQNGNAILFGPVADPQGSLGVAVVEAHSEADVRAMTAGDPVIRVNAGFSFEVFLMPRAVVRPQVAASGAQT